MTKIYLDRFPIKAHLSDPFQPDCQVALEAQRSPANLNKREKFGEKIKKKGPELGSYPQTELDEYTEIQIKEFR